MVTLNNKAQLFVVISTVLGIVVGIALNAQWRSWGAYAGSGALIALDLVYRGAQGARRGDERFPVGADHSFSSGIWPAFAPRFIEETYA